MSDRITEQVSKVPEGIPRTNQNWQPPNAGDLKVALAAMRSKAEVSSIPHLDLPEETKKTDSASAREQLVQSMAKSGLPPERLSAFGANLAKFETNAHQSNSPDEVIADTFKQMNRVINASSGIVEADLRQKFVEQWSGKLADPFSARQGWHDDCGVAVMEARNIVRRPDKLTAKLADALLTGATQVPDDRRSYFGLLTSNRPEAKGTRPLLLDKASLHPDREAQGKSKHENARDYADQVAQVVLNGIKWDMAERSPSGYLLPQGHMKYNQAEKIERPSDTSPPDTDRNTSGESVAVRDLLGFKTSYNENGHGYGGESSEADMERMQFGISGDQNMFTLTPDSSSGLDGFKKSLAVTLDKSTNLAPIAAFVHPSYSPFREEYLRRHPEKTEVSNEVGWHIIGIKKLNSDGTVDIYNPWGINSRIKIEDLYQANRSPAK